MISVEKEGAALAKASAEAHQQVRIPSKVRPLTYDTGMQLVKAVATCYGETVTDDDAGYLLWNHTGFPGFFQSKPIEECRHQVARFFRELQEYEQ